MSKIISLVAIILIASGICAAQHGGKAEGRRVKFKPGATSATFTDKVSGSLEIEYELQAQAGQELIIRVASDPSGDVQIKALGPNARVLEMSCLAAKQPESKKLGLPTPSHCYEHDPQIVRREGRTWSATLPESGNYVVSVYKPDGGRAVSNYTLLMIVPPGRDPSEETLAPGGVASLEASMRRFISALKKKDVATFLSLFSRTGFFYANNPLNVMRVAVSYSELESDVRKKSGWYCSYLQRCDELDAFVDNIGDGEMWPRPGGAKFVPPGDDASSATFVRWRKEAGRWVIAEIAYPQA